MNSSDDNKVVKKVLTLEQYFTEIHQNPFSTTGEGYLVLGRIPHQDFVGANFDDESFKKDLIMLDPVDIPHLSNVDFRKAVVAGVNIGEMFNSGIGTLTGSSKLEMMTGMSYINECSSKVSIEHMSLRAHLTLAKDLTKIGYMGFDTMIGTLYQEASVDRMTDNSHIHWAWGTIGDMNDHSYIKHLYGVVKKKSPRTKIHFIDEQGKVLGKNII